MHKNTTETVDYTPFAFLLLLVQYASCFARVLVWSETLETIFNKVNTEEGNQEYVQMFYKHNNISQLQKVPLYFIFRFLVFRDMF